MEQPVEDLTIRILQRIRLLRRVRGISQSEVAQRLGISQNAYCRIENNQRELSLERYLGIAHVLGIPPHELLRGEGRRIKLLLGDGESRPTSEE